MPFKIVPQMITPEMEAAGWIDKEDVCPCDIYAAMLDAAPALTDAEIDGLCRKMWPTHPEWGRGADSPDYEAYRQGDRVRMRAFLAAIQEP